MQIAYAVLRLLSDGRFHSGTSLAQHLKVSRSNIWKGIAFLRQLGVSVQAVSGRGYRWYEPMELLCEKKIRSFINPLVQSYIAKINVHNIVASTNDYLLHKVAEGLIESGTICIAEGQSAGRGRQGRVWNSPLGANIYFSFYWRFTKKLHDLSGWSLVVALGLLEALKNIAPLPKALGIKWPNDLWYQHAKLCGILVESVTRAHQPKGASSDIVTGIGMNVAMPWQQINSQLTDLKQIFGFTPSRNLLIATILNTLVPMLLQFQQSGFGAFQSLWEQYDLLKEKKVQLFFGADQEEGIAHGVNDRGELCVQVGNTLKAIRYGEVSVRPEL